MKTVTTLELSKGIENGTVTVIDARSVDTYNGWKLNTEPRGGHIKGARSLPFKWLKYMDWIEIVQSKEIKSSDSLIIYGYDENKTNLVALQFERAGYQDVSLYNHFVDEWCTDNSLPMEKLARYQQLVSPEWLHQLKTTGTAPEYSNNKFVICHAHYRNRSAYDEGHIQGAIEVDTNTLESPETWNRRTPEELKTALESLGITKDTTVILYGRFSFPDNDDDFLVVVQGI